MATPSRSLPVASTLAESALETLVPAVLTFSFEEAKRHLIKEDHRFGDIFDLVHCKPFEHLEQVDPFRTLTHSILGQQISWLAARSITHRFVRLFDPSLPEKPVDHNKFSRTTDFFPTAHQVTTMDIPTLRTAGLSQRKAEYVLDLASRFADGRLSTEKVLAANDEELYEMLIEVRGIGRVIDMFAIFSLRRPDILPVGDLGVQRGILRWFLSRHSSAYTVSVSPLKQTKQLDSGKATEDSKEDDDSDVLPVLNQTSKTAERNEEPDDVGVSSVPPAPSLPSTPGPKGKKGKKKAVAKSKNDSDTEDTGVLPTPFTPSIIKTLNKALASSDIPPLPAGLTVVELKKRLDTKKKIKGAFLTPQEMEALTEPWRPYRSLGVYYMWALAEEPK
ncbi:DNA glycosylase [Irpex rosettiformis]|uniref:DNA glycosylase n=1 Tax=Irpex rosettiformis TaxID=378272 RepID=A0ACB8U0W6_9APHY|nr:DNA glycosylase [Irpex rosettiformis]